MFGPVAVGCAACICRFRPLAQRKLANIVVESFARREQVLPFANGVAALSPLLNRSCSSKETGAMKLGKMVTDSFKPSASRRETTVVRLPASTPR